MKDIWNFPDIVHLKISEEKGRCIIANRDIKAGEVIWLEYPFIYIVFEEFLDSVCDTCLKYIGTEKLANIIVCNGCSVVKYCSNICKSNSEGIHKFECKLMKNKFKNISQECGVTFDRVRILFRFIIVNLFSKNNFGIFSNIQHENKLLYSSYEHVKTLVSHISEFCQERKSIYLSLAFELLNIFENSQYHKTFGLDNYEIEASISLSTMDLVEILCIIDSNSFGIPIFASSYYSYYYDNILKNSNSSIENPSNSLQLSSILLSPNIIAWGLFPYASLINHSCEPNCSYLGNDESTRYPYIEIRSTTNISKGDEITISYIELYESRKQRISQLYKTKYFICRCTRCKQDLYKSMDYFIEGILCYNCAKLKNQKVLLKCISSNFYDILKNEDYNQCISILEQESDLISIIAAQYKCTNCQLIYNGSEIANLIKNIEDIIDESSLLNNEYGDVHRAIELLRSALDNYLLKNTQIHCLHYLIYRCCKLLGFWSVIIKEWGYVEHYIGQMIKCNIAIFKNKNNLDTSNLYAARAIALENLGSISEAQKSWNSCLAIREICCGCEHSLYRFVARRLHN
ncbi:SET domain-containing protein [Cryptosporidium andersoni]|uniref:SET domain-containing protein n=1 Tax=Cryptosporidium andersoni TaxID=117008 RepID=A0A1J4MVS8_9CRYT|nr:SET domain-containing protein [Cryptosporidium andersoni]